jgi:hypothetical protein
MFVQQMSLAPCLAFGPGSVGCTFSNTILNDALYNNNVTMMAWVKTNGYSSGEVCIMGCDISTTTGLHLKILNGKYVFGIFANPKSILTSQSTSPEDQPLPNPGVSADIIEGDDGYWTHICGCFDRSTRMWSIMRNGFVMASTSGAGWVQLAGTARQWYLGGRGNTSMPCLVKMRAVWLFNQVLNITDLRQKYVSRYSPVTTPTYPDIVIAFWALSEGSGTRINDGNYTSQPINFKFTASSGATWSTDFSVGNITFLLVSEDDNRIYQSGTFKDSWTGGAPLLFAGPFIYEMGRDSSIRDLTLRMSLIGCGAELTTISGYARQGNPGGGTIAVYNTTNAILRQFEVVNIIDIDDIVLPSGCAIFIDSSVEDFRIERVHASVKGISHTLNDVFQFHTVSILTHGLISDCIIKSVILESVNYQVVGSELLTYFATVEVNNTKMIATYSRAMPVRASGGIVTLNNCDIEAYIPQFTSLQTISGGQIIVNECIIVGGSLGSNITINPPWSCITQ